MPPRPLPRDLDLPIPAPVDSEGREASPGWDVSPISAVSDLFSLSLDNSSDAEEPHPLTMSSIDNLVSPPKIERELVDFRELEDSSESAGNGIPLQEEQMVHEKRAPDSFDTSDDESPARPVRKKARKEARKDNKKRTRNRFDTPDELLEQKKARKPASLIDSVRPGDLFYIVGEHTHLRKELPPPENTLSMHTMVQQALTRQDMSSPFCQFLFTHAKYSPKQPGGKGAREIFERDTHDQTAKERRAYKALILWALSEQRTLHCLLPHDFNSQVAAQKYRYSAQKHLPEFDFSIHNSLVRQIFRLWLEHANLIDISIRFYDADANEVEAPWKTDPEAWEKYHPKQRAEPAYAHSAPAPHAEEDDEWAEGCIANGLV